MKLLISLSLVAVAGLVSNYASASGSNHLVGAKLWPYPFRPEVFKLNLYKDNEFIRTCKGTEIATRSKIMWITAAECLDYDKYDQIEVEVNLFGSFDRIKFNFDGLFAHVHYVHPDYNKATGEHNIALITPLLNYVDLDQNLRRLLLPHKGETFEWKEAQIFGEYEKMILRGTEMYRIRAIQTHILDQKSCEMWLGLHRNNNTVCVSGLQHQGISEEHIGIPVVVRENYDTFVLLGIATKIRTWTALSRLPMEFLSINPYLQWIQSF